MKILFSFIVGMAIAGSVSAQTKPTPAKKAVNQQAIINQGLKSGKLTPKQAADIKARAAAVKQNGKPTNINKVLTPAEKAKLAALAKQKTNTAKK